MSKLLLTFAVGEHQPLLEVALPSFARYAARHGYELHVTECKSGRRAPSWGKIPALRRALASYEQVLWVDADCVIVDPSEDLLDHVPPEACQALVAHERPRGEAVPNCGVWLVRRPMLPHLKAIWESTRWDTHCWWEQAALLERMGYQIKHCTVRRGQSARLASATCLLPGSWNVTARQEGPHARILHAANQPDRLQLMRRWARRLTQQDASPKHNATAHSHAEFQA
jgi:hypothetical protein